MTGAYRKSASWWAVMGGIVVGLVVIDTALLGRWPLFGVRPDLVLVFAVGLALRRGPWEGAALSLAAGLVHDLLGGHLIGLSAVGYGAAAWVAGLAGERLYPERWMIGMGAVAAGTLVSEAVYVAGAHAFGVPLPGGMLGMVLPGLIGYHLLLTPIVFPISRWAAGLLSARDSGEVAIQG
ncbi:MAG: rod shape-determining protein MreD [Firmicutes bacterium]|nr:rod shape-determining protein MreD [Bacillota bacterium]